MWAARDKNGNLGLYINKPYKYNDEWCVNTNDYMCIDGGLLSSVKWEDNEPTEVFLSKENIESKSLVDEVSQRVFKQLSEQLTDFLVKGIKSEKVVNINISRIFDLQIDGSQPTCEAVLEVINKAKQAMQDVVVDFTKSIQ